MHAPLHGHLAKVGASLCALPNDDLACSGSVFFLSRIKVKGIQQQKSQEEERLRRCDKTDGSLPEQARFAGSQQRTLQLSQLPAGAMPIERPLSRDKGPAASDPIRGCPKVPLLRGLSKPGSRPCLPPDSVKATSRNKTPLSATPGSPRRGAATEALRDWERRVSAAQR